MEGRDGDARAARRPCHGVHQPEDGVCWVLDDPISPNAVGPLDDLGHKVVELVCEPDPQLIARPQARKPPRPR
eukprot:4049349-Lingulodinium_polyedra.AAC.1